MPLTGWLCPQCKREVPLDHFTKGDCRFVVHPDYADAQVKDRRQHEYPDALPSVTMALGCPRSNAIMKIEDYSVDPLSLNAPATGTAWHAWIDPHTQESEVELQGVIDGVNLTGQTDRLDKALRLIEDHKHKSDFGMKHVKTKGAAIEHQAQLALYAELCEQQEGWRPTDYCLWYHSSSNRDAFVPVRGRVMGLEDALAIKPHNGSYTVRELLHQAAKPAGEWRDLPLSGKDMSFGDKSMCDYCAVRSICWTADSGAPF